MLRVIPPFLVGVVGTAFLVEYILWSTPALICAFSFVGVSVLSGFVIGFFNRNGHYFGLAVWLLMIALGAGLTLSVSDQVFDKHISDVAQGKSTYVIQIDDEPVVKEKSVKITARLTTDRLTNFGRVLLYFNRDSMTESLKYGQILAIRSALKKVENQGNPNEFNYKRYLRFHRISSRGYVKSGQFKVLSERSSGLRGGLFQVRRKLIGVLEDSGLQESQLAVASALILGYRAELDQELMSAYAGAGATHVLAVSGLHVGIVYVILNFLLKFMDKRRSTKVAKTLILIVLLFGYAGLTGLSASVFRAATMFSFVAVGKALKRDTNIFNTLAASAFCLIAYDPMIIMQVGFQLSYAAVIGIVLIHPRLFNLYAFNNRLLDWAWSISCVSIAAQIATFPLGLLYFHQFPNLFLISNLLVIPAAALILYVGFSLFVFSFWEPSLKFFGFLLDTIIYWLNRIVSAIEAVPNSVLTGIDISTTETLMVYFIIATTLLFVAQKARKALYLALAMACIFMGFQIIEVYQQTNQQFLTIYNVRGETAVALFNGTRVIFLTSEEFFENEQSMLFHVQHHWWNRGVTEVEFIELTDSLFNRVTIWGDMEFSIVSIEGGGKSILPSAMGNQLDFIYLHNISWDMINKIDEFGETDVYTPNRYGAKTKEKISSTLEITTPIFVSESIQLKE
jgi:competence protein ComEC